MKRCSGCRTEKPLDAFGKNRRTSDGRHFYCRPCANEATRLHRQRNPEKKQAYERRHTLRYKYGLTEADYEAMVEAQGGLCAICGQCETRRPFLLSVDHDHETGVVRGLLCHRCNTALGLFQDDPARIRVAAEYLSGSLV